jgi:hypothetical protein
MKLNPRHKYLILDNLRITGRITHLTLSENEVYTGRQILKQLKDPDYITSRAFGPKPVYDINTKKVYLFEMDDLKIPSTPDLVDNFQVDQHLVPLQMLLDLDRGKLPKYLNHRYITVRNLARYLISN